MWVDCCGLQNRLFPKPPAYLQFLSFVLVGLISSCIFLSGGSKSFYFQSPFREFWTTWVIKIKHYPGPYSVEMSAGILSQTGLSQAVFLPRTSAFLLSWSPMIWTGLTGQKRDWLLSPGRVTRKAPSCLPSRRTRRVWDNWLAVCLRWERGKTAGRSTWTSIIFHPKRSPSAQRMATCKYQVRRLNFFSFYT